MTLWSKQFAQNKQVKELMNNGHTFKILFIKTPHGKFMHHQVVALVSPEIREVISAHGNRLYIGLISAKVYDQFYVKCCIKCNCFGHYKADCDKPTACGFCSSEEHESESCQKKTSDNHSVFKCVNCKRVGLVFEGHSASWSKCPAYVIAQKKMQSTIPYYEGLKK